jgi:hypothetical protein
MKSLLSGASNTLFLIAGLLFFFGGRVIHASTKMGRVNAEILGIGAAVVFAIVGMVAKGVADNLDDEDSAAQ